MNGPLDIDPQRIGLIGDWDADAFAAERAVRFAAEREAEVLFQLGDFGHHLPPGRPHKLFRLRLESALEQADLDLFWVGGNHDNHGHLAALPIDPTTSLRATNRRIWNLPRGHRWTYDGHT